MTIYFDNYVTLQEELFSAMKNQHPQSGKTVIMLIAKDKVVGLALVLYDLMNFVIIISIIILQKFK